MSSFSHLRSHKYIDLVTFRKNGIGVHTPVWFAGDDDRLYVFSNPKSGKLKRIRNNPRVEIAPCTMRGKVVGPQFPATVRILPQQEWDQARNAIHAKYWLTRIPFLWSKRNVYLEITV